MNSSIRISATLAGLRFVVNMVRLMDNYVVLIMARTPPAEGTHGRSRPRPCSLPGADAGGERQLRNRSRARAPGSLALPRSSLRELQEALRNLPIAHPIALEVRRELPMSCGFWSSYELSRVRMRWNVL